MGKQIMPPILSTGDVDLEAESIMLPVVDRSEAVASPSTIARFWHEPEFASKRDEQGKLWSAEGEVAARPTLVTSAGGTLASNADESIVAAHAGLLMAALTIYTNALEALSPYRRRTPKAKSWHYLAKAAFLLGDLAGIATAAIWMGEIPAIAIIMAVSAATATVTAGLSGAEVRDVRDRVRRARAADDLPPQLLPFAHHFDAPDRGWPFVKAVVFVSVGIGATIACAIFGLRTSIEGPLSGIVYGGIAGAIAAASWLEQYCYTDAISDQIDGARADYERERAQHQVLAASSAVKATAEATTEAESIVREHTLRGGAAGDHLDALSHAIKRRNPAVAGHGPAAEPTAIGQTTRRTGGAK